MLDFLYAKHMRRYSPGLIEILARQKQLKKLFIFIFSADSHILDLHKQRRILKNASDHIIRNSKYLLTFTLPFFRVKEPVFQGFPFPHHIFTDACFCVFLHFQHGVWNLQFAAHHLFQKLLLHKRLIFPKRLLDPS